MRHPRALDDRSSRGPAPAALRLAALLGLLLFVVPAVAAPGADDEPPAEPARARLVADVTSLSPGRTFRLGVHFTMVKHWHIYWHSARDGGVGTQVAWRLPAGWRAGPLEWPKPRRYDLAGEGIAFGYDDEVLLAAEITIPPGAEVPESGKITLGAELSWLVCKEICLIGEGSPSLELPFRASTEPASPSESRPLFDRARAQLPRKASELTATHRASFSKPEPASPPTGWTVELEWRPQERPAERPSAPSTSGKGGKGSGFSGWDRPAGNAGADFELFPFDVPGATLGLGTVEPRGGQTRFHFTLEVWDRELFDPARVGAVIAWRERGEKGATRAIRITGETPPAAGRQP